jgi:hypothetical protein
MTATRTAQNRQNARQSTGPRTDAGKDATSRNALRHGLTARRWPVLPDEQDAYTAHHDELLREAAPVGALETALSEQVALLLWRLRRCASVEAGLLEWWQHQALALHAHAERTGDDPILARCFHADPATVAASQATEAAAHTRQSSDWPALGHGFARDAGAFATLSRYETAIEAALTRTLANLRQVQAARCACETNPPDAG